MAELAEKDAAPSSAKGIEIMALGQQGSSSSDPERSAILSSNGGQAATLYTGDARAVEGAERPMVLAWKSIKRIVGIRQTPVGLEAGNKRAVAALIVLFFVSVLNQADRWVLPVVAPVGMRCYLTGDSCSNASRSEASCGCVDFNTYDQGVLTGPAFCAVYVISGIPLSYVADRISRTWVLAVGLTFWSIMVFATGFVKTTWQLYLTRMGLGIGEVRFAMRTCMLGSWSLRQSVGERELGNDVGISAGPQPVLVTFESRPDVCVCVRLCDVCHCGSGAGTVVCCVCVYRRLAHQLPFPCCRTSFHRTCVHWHSLATCPASTLVELRLMDWEHCLINFAGHGCLEYSVLLASSCCPLYLLC
eukprot:scpid64345/ scgid5891/ Protein spinster homolog 1